MNDKKNKKFKIKTSELLIKLSKINNAINLKRKYLYENEIINIQKELNISYENSKDIVEVVYSDIFDNIYNELSQTINYISNDIIENYTFEFEGYRFLEPRFYFSRKNKDTEKDKADWDGIRNFFKMGSHKGYPFNQLTEEQWGVQYL